MYRSFENKRLSQKFAGIGSFTVLALLLLAFFIATPAASSQAVYGSIYGAATDKTGAAIPNATITVTDVSKGTAVTATTNGSGEYRVQHLIPDTYKVEANANGYSKSVTDNVIVYADTSPQVNLQLTIGAVSTTVEVTGGAPMLETDRAEVSTILDARAVENLPNMDRNFTEFELLTPGTSYIGWGPGEGGGNPQRSGSIEVDGQLPFATGYELDGTDNQEPLNGVAVINPNLDAISEMKVTAQNYDAEFGKAVAGLVTAQTKSGSNNWHGTAFEYRRSNAQQARDPFANAPSASDPNPTLPPTLHNQFGGSVGGPIKKDKLFFFVDYQGLREKTGTSTLTTVPTALALSTCTSGSGFCDLSDYLSSGLQAYQPNSLTDTTDLGRTAFPDNHIPAADLSPAAVAFFKLLPAPNAGATGAVENNYAARGSGIFNTNQPDIRVDYQLTQKFHLFGRYTLFQGNLSGAPFFGLAGGQGFGPGNFAGTDAFHYSSVASGGDYVVSPKWVTDFRFGYYNIYNDTTGPDSTSPLGNNLGIPNANLTPLSLYGGMPQFNVTILGNGANNGTNVEYGTSAALSIQKTSQYQIVNNWSHNLGNHNIKFGVDLRYGKNDTLAEGGSGNVNFNGTYYANASRTGGQSPSGVISPGNGYATFLLGDVTSYVRSVSSTGGAGQSTQKRVFAYAQDQWRATPKISLNYGLRWELYTPEAVTAKGEGGLLNIYTGTLNIAGYGNFNNQINVQDNYKNFAPRIGVTYQMFPNTVFRAGYGIVYGQGWSGNTFGDVLTGSYPLQIEQNLEPASSTSFGAVFNLTATEDGVPAGPPGYTFPTIPTNGEYVLPNGISQSTRPTTMRLPTVGGWNVEVQQEITPTLSLQIGYIGSEAYHNMFDSSNQFNANEGTPAGFEQINPNTGVDYTLCEREPFCGDAGGTAQSLFHLWGVSHGWTQGINDNFNEATGSYNALQVVVTKRLSNGLSFLSHYTWSHAIDHESYEFMINSKIGRGSSYYNRRNAFVFAGDYDLPFGKGKEFASKSPGWLDEIIGGFQLNATVTVDSGIPFTPCYSEVSSYNDIAANDGCGPSFPNKSHLAGPNIHKGKFDPVSLTVPFLPTAPTVNIPGGGTSAELIYQPNQTFGAYSLPAVGAFGNWGRNSLWGPGLFDVDASIAKNFTLHDNLKMQLIAQGFNVFNHVNLANPSSCIDCAGTSGEIQGTLSEQYGTSLRFLQFAARFTF